MHELTHLARQSDDSGSAGDGDAGTSPVDQTDTSPSGAVADGMAGPTMGGVDTGSLLADTAGGLTAGLLGVSLPKVRSLDPAELALARPVYGSSLNYGDIKLSDTLGAGGRPWTTYVPLIGTMINIGPSAYATPGSDRDLLIHEMAHSWQSQHHSNRAAYMANAVASMAAAGIAGGSAYCYIPGKPFSEYGAEQGAQQVERGEAPVISHMAGVSAGAVDPDLIAGLTIPHWETPGAAGVRC